MHWRRQKRAPRHARCVVLLRPTRLRKRERKLPERHSLSLRRASRQTHSCQAISNGVRSQCHLTPLHSPTALRTNIHIYREYMPEQPRPRLATLVPDIRCQRLVEMPPQERELHRVWHGRLVRRDIRPRRGNHLLTQLRIRYARQ